MGVRQQLEQLRRKLEAARALRDRATTPGERAAAQAAMDRLQARIEAETPKRKERRPRQDETGLISETEFENELAILLARRWGRVAPEVEVEIILPRGRSPWKGPWG